MKTIVLGIMAAFVGMWAWILTLPHAIVILVVLQILDVISGTVVAWGDRSLSSIIAEAGIKKKVYAWIIIMVVGLLQWELKQYIHVEVILNYTPMEVAALGFATAEALSILENADTLGLWLPHWLRSSLATANKALDGGTDE